MLKVNFKQALKCVCLIILASIFLSSCSLNKIGKNEFVFVAKCQNNKYMAELYSGFEEAASEFKAVSYFKAPEKATIDGQINIINELIEEKVDGIAISANDEDDLNEVLKKATDAGINIISLDSAVNKESRILHIHQADFEKIGRSIMQDAYNMIDGSGGIAILSSTEDATNQNLWIEWIYKEIVDNPDKYMHTPILKVVYGEDDINLSKEKTRELLKNNDIKVIIAPTTVGIVAAAEVIKETNSDVLVTGVGLPSEMYEYVKDGICPSMYLWNPKDMGILAAYALNSLDKGDIKGDGNDTFVAGSLGEVSVNVTPDGSTEIILGDPIKFDLSNVEYWKDII